MLVEVSDGRGGEIAGGMVEEVGGSTVAGTGAEGATALADPFTVWFGDDSAAEKICCKVSESHDMADHRRCRHR